MPAPANSPVSLKLDPVIKSRVGQLASAKKRTAHWIMREAIAQYVEREEKRDAFRQATLAGWKDFQETGLHITADEAFAWLDSWGDANEPPPPKCHD